MTFQIEWYDAAQDDLRSLEREVAKRILKKVRSIELNPFHFVETLEGYPVYKLRVGDYRVILNIDASKRFIAVILVGHRSKVYQELRRRINP